MCTRFKRKLADIIAHSVSRILPKAVARDKRYFDLWERKGFHITPVHYYEPIPDTRMLKDELWSKGSRLVGININEENQLELLSVFTSRFQEEYNKFPRDRTSTLYEYYINCGNFENVDGEILYCMIRYYKPKKIFEIGSGFSTFLSAQAILKNQEEDDKYQCELIAIEPYPNEVFQAGFPGLSKLIAQNVQDVPLSEFRKLEKNDILFVDSTHVLKVGSDVQYEYLEVIPQLRKGVIIHAHDIFLPAEYPKDWILRDHLFWTEQYLLQAFLAFNDSYEILWGGNYMHQKYPEKLAKTFSSYRERDKSWVGPGSFWFRKVVKRRAR